MTRRAAEGTVGGADPSRRRAVPAGLLGMLGLLVLVESSVARRPLRFLDVPSLSRRFSARAAVREAPGHDLLLLGDSLVKVGLVPEVVRGRSGRSAYNLAAVSAPAPATYFVLRKALESGARPRAVVVDFGPGLLAASPERDARIAPELLGLREGLDLALTARDPTLLASLALYGLLPSLRGRWEVRNGVRAALRGKRDPQVETNSACLRNWQVNGGAHVAASNPHFRNETEPGRAGRGRPRVDRVNATYVGRLFDLASSRGIRVFWLLPPESPQTRDQRRRAGIEAWYTRFARSMQAKHPEVTVLDARHSGYDRALFCDPTHLEVRGAVALSTALADRLSGRADAPTAGPLWVELPPPGATPPGRLPEDFDQSRVALGLGDGPRATDAAVLR